VFSLPYLDTIVSVWADKDKSEDIRTPKYFIQVIFPMVERVSQERVGASWKRGWTFSC